MEDLPQRLILDTTPPEHLTRTEQMMRLLDELYRDYHDFKGNPQMDVKLYANYLNLSLKTVEALLQDMTFTRYAPDQLLEMGFDFSRQLWNPSEAVEVNFPHRQMIYLTPLAIYLDPSEPGKRYVG